MASQFQIRKALGRVPNMAAFLRRHADNVAERTAYRQRAENPPPMRPSVARRLELALIEEGLLKPKE